MATQVLDRNAVPCKTNEPSDVTAKQLHTAQVAANIDAYLAYHNNPEHAAQYNMLIHDEAVARS